tara:strand:- start:187 stop:660 length:474 start_codon:yes stop_codon:yes gene_type:complete
MAIPSGAAATDALSSIGSDLSFAVSFAIANELLAAAREEQIEDSELIGVVFLTSVCLSALPKALVVLSAEMAKAFSGPKEKSEKVVADIESNVEQGILGFVTFLLQIFQRISLTVTIQLVTSAVQTSQPLRSVRLLSLLSVLFFFVFLRQTATIGKK